MILAQFPQIQRVIGKEAVGIKTRIGEIEYGRTIELAGRSSELVKNRMLDKIESELRGKVAACVGTPTVQDLGADAQVTGPSVVFKCR